MDLRTFLRQLAEDGAVDALALNEFAQFGLPGQPEYLGASLLPEVLVPRNMYRENRVRYRTMIATDGTRYSPAQKQGGAILSASFPVELGDSDIAQEFTANDYDALMDHLNADADMEAAAAILGWGQAGINMGLVEFNEKQRWQAIELANVTRRSDNSVLEPVAYLNPPGHRVNAAADWTLGATDILGEILAMKDFAATKGMTINRIVTSTAVRSVMLLNESVRQAILPSTLTLVGGTASTQQVGSVGAEALNNYLQSHQLPPVEVYDRQYLSPDGSSNRFMTNNSFHMFATTGRDVNVVSLADPENFRFLASTLGYVGVGRAAGQRTPGRVIQMEGFTNKPPRIEAEGWQTSLPVITEPEAIFRIGAITLPA